MSHPGIIFIVGPTAVGKSDIAVELAQRVDGEIVSCDSMQVYRECPVAGNQPSREQMEAVVHHLIGCVSMAEDFNVMKYARLANPTIEEIIRCGKTPVVVGGSGLYVNALLDGIFEGEGADLRLRDQLLTEANEFGADHLHRKLAELDPVAAQNIHPNNVKRVIRALEVCLQNEQPMSMIQKHRSGLYQKYPVRMFGLMMERERLYQRINQRVLKMIENGLIAEIQGLDDLELSQTAKYLIGVQDIQEFLRGECDLDHAIEMMQLKTRHLAKRQMTWFRKDDRIKWMDVHPDFSVKEAAERILNELS